MKKLFIVLILTVSISGCAVYPASREYPRGYSQPTPAYWYGYQEAYRYTPYRYMPHRRYYHW